jgi:AraC-like DNA-binding protein
LPIAQGGALTDSYTKHGIFISPTEEELPQIDAFFSMIWDAVHKVPFRREVVQHLIMALLYNIRYIHAKNEESAPLQLSRQEEVFRRFIGLVNEHSKRERNISFYADKLCLTPHYLSTVIREVSGQTVMQWINQAIILEAKVLLKHSDCWYSKSRMNWDFPIRHFSANFLNG